MINAVISWTLPVPATAPENAPGSSAVVPVSCLVATAKLPLVIVDPVCSVYPLGAVHVVVAPFHEAPNAIARQSEFAGVAEGQFGLLGLLLCVDPTADALIGEPDDTAPDNAMIAHSE
jgi:hypothetical protein